MDDDLGRTTGELIDAQRELSEAEWDLEWFERAVKMAPSNSNRIMDAKNDTQRKMISEKILHHLDNFPVAQGAPHADNEVGVWYGYRDAVRRATLRAHEAQLLREDVMIRARAV